MGQTLNGFAGNTYSQFGEDGILGEAFSRLGIDRGFFVEFGAWNGTYLSNAYRLYREARWSGLLIEADHKRYLDLLKNIPEDTIQKLNVFVRPSGANSLDQIFLRQNVNESFDFLSIDVDSDDYRIWESLRSFMPIVVSIEFNPTIPNAVFYVQPEGAHKGNSARALYELGEKKGYTCFASTACNLLFVRNDFFPKLGLGAPTLDEVRPEEVHIFTLFDGEIVYQGLPTNKQGEVFHPWRSIRMPQLPDSAGWVSKKISFVSRLRRKISWQKLTKFGVK